MHSLQIELKDSAFRVISRAAKAQGVTVEKFLAEQLSNEYVPFGNVQDSFFTPLVLAEIDAAAAEAQQGGGLPMDEVMARMGAKSRAWRENHPA